jgi:hypothetical protein
VRQVRQVSSVEGLYRSCIRVEMRYSRPRCARSEKGGGGQYALVGESKLVQLSIDEQNAHQHTYLDLLIAIFYEAQYNDSHVIKIHSIILNYFIPNRSRAESENQSHNSTPKLKVQAQLQRGRNIII